MTNMSFVDLRDFPVFFEPSTTHANCIAMIADRISPLLAETTASTSPATATPFRLGSSFASSASSALRIRVGATGLNATWCTYGDVTSCAGRMVRMLTALVSLPNLPCSSRVSPRTPASLTMITSGHEISAGLSTKSRRDA